MVLHSEAFRSFRLLSSPGQGTRCPWYLTLDGNDVFMHFPFIVHFPCLRKQSDGIFKHYINLPGWLRMLVIMCHNKLECFS